MAGIRPATGAPNPLVSGKSALYTPVENNNKQKQGRMIMPRHSIFASVSFVVFAALLAGTGNLAAQSGSAALTGKITAGQDALEGVLVSAKKNGSTITVTVVSDKDGRYTFPAA